METYTAAVLISVLLVVPLFICKADAEPRVCKTKGGNMLRYNNSIQICKDGRIYKNTDIRVCGTGIYNKLKQICKDGVIYSKTMCCENSHYQPEFQTCCRLNSTSCQVHSDRPEHDHVCCGLVAYKIVDALPCRRMYMNDRLWNAESVTTHWEDVCSIRTEGYEYLLRIKTKIDSAEETFFESILILIRSGKTDVRTDVNVPYDSYSPTEKLTGSAFFIRSKLNYTNNRNFYLNLEDIVYKVPEHHRGKRRYKMFISNNCKR